MLKTITNLFLNRLLTKGTEQNENGNSLKYAPTSEEINISIDFYYWNLLLYLFPNTFSNDKEAYDFYQDFCKRAREVNENQDIYKIPEHIWLNYKIDMLSGLIVTWNSYNSSPQANVHFSLLKFEDIKDENLKNEVIKLYEDNYEHLNKLGIANRFSNGNLYELTHFVVNTSGIYKNTYWAHDYCHDSFCWEKETRFFTLPIENVIVDLRKIKTNQHALSDEQVEEIKNNIEKEYADYKCKFNIEDYEVELQNQIFTAYVKTKYFYPADDTTLSFDEPKLPYKNIDLI